MDLGAHSLSLTPHGSLLLIRDDDAQRLDTHFKGTDPTGARPWAGHVLSCPAPKGINDCGQHRGAVQR